MSGIRDDGGTGKRGHQEKGQNHLEEPWKSLVKGRNGTMERASGGGGKEKRSMAY